VQVEQNSAHVLHLGLVNSATQPTAARPLGDRWEMEMTWPAIAVPADSG
jgi:hypothetical protein